MNFLPDSDSEDEIITTTKNKKKWQNRKKIFGNACK